MARLEGFGESKQTDSGPFAQLDFDFISELKTSSNDKRSTRELKHDFHPRWPFDPYNPFEWQVEHHPRGTFDRNDPPADQPLRHPPEMPPPEIAHPNPPAQPTPPDWITTDHLSDTTTVPAPPPGFADQNRPDRQYIYTRYDGVNHTATSIPYVYSEELGWHAIRAGDGDESHILYAQRPYEGSAISMTRWTQYDPIQARTSTVSMFRNGFTNRWFPVQQPDGSTIVNTSWDGGITAGNRPPWLLTSGLSDTTEIPGLPRQPRANELYVLSYTPPNTDTTWTAGYMMNQGTGQLELLRRGNQFSAWHTQMPVTEEPSWNVYSADPPHRLLERYTMTRTDSGRWYSGERYSLRQNGTGYDYQELPPPPPIHDEH